MTTSRKPAVSREARYAQKACACRPGLVCRHCRRWLPAGLARPGPDHAQAILTVMRVVPGTRPIAHRGCY